MESTEELDKIVEAEKKIRDLVYQQSQIMKACLNESVMLIKKLIHSDKLDEFVDVSDNPAPDFTKQFVVAMAVQMATKIYDKVKNV
jgi:hypothetical protein